LIIINLSGIYEVEKRRSKNTKKKSSTANQNTPSPRKMGHAWCIFVLCWYMKRICLLNLRLFLTVKY
jgi:hypothetical protein